MCVIATGPLTEAVLMAEQIAWLAPVRGCAELLRRGRPDCHLADSRRYGPGAFAPNPATAAGEDDAYLNCPMNQEEYEAFYKALIGAERARVHEFDVNNPKVYEGCMPVEVMAAARERTPSRFGPLKAGRPAGSQGPAIALGRWCSCGSENRDGDPLQSGRASRQTSGSRSRGGCFP